MLSPFGLVAKASNIVDGTNPSYTVSDFRAIMPQFTSDVIPDNVLSMYVDLANNVVKEARWHSYWLEGMRLFISHFASLYVITSAPTPPAGEEAEDYVAPSVASLSAVRGIVSNKKVDQISVSYDLSVINKDLEGWGAWKETIYGEQFATLARMIAGKGGMYVW